MTIAILEEHLITQNQIKKRMDTTILFKYDFSNRALQKWESSRLTVHGNESELDISFDIKGSTCSNMGWPIIFSIKLNLIPLANDYKIQKATIQFTEDQGYKKMCYFEATDNTLTTLEKAPFEEGETINKIIEKLRKQQPSGCLCTKKGRNYFWNIALQTTHYHLNK